MTDTASVIARMCEGFAPTSDEVALLPAVLSVDPVAGLLAASPWWVYESVKAGTCPVVPIRVGRRLKWRTSDVLALIGVT